MAGLLVKIVVRLALCALVTWAMYRVLGLVAVVICAPLVGVAIARPLIDLVATAHYAGKSHALGDVQGKYWSHRGHCLDIAEDDDKGRWLLVDDVRKHVQLPRDEVLRKQFGDRAAVIEPAPGLRLRADALSEYLVKSTDAASLRFRNWLDREVRGGAVNPRKGRIT